MQPTFEEQHRAIRPEIIIQARGATDEAALVRWVGARDFESAGVPVDVVSWGPLDGHVADNQVGLHPCIRVGTTSASDIAAARAWTRARRRPLRAGRGSDVRSRSSVVRPACNVHYRRAGLWLKATPRLQFRRRPIQGTYTFIAIAACLVLELRQLLPVSRGAQPWIYRARGR